MEDIDSYIGKQIRSRRRLLKLTQTELGKGIGVTFQQIQKYEKGLNKISACKLFDLTKELSVPISYFFDGFTALPTVYDHLFKMEEETSEFQYDENSESDENIDLIEVFNKFSDKELKKKLLMFLEALAPN